MKNFQHMVITTLFLITFLFPSAFAKIVVVNSQNWWDVYAGILYAKEHGMEAYFLNSPNPEGLFRILPPGQNVLLIQSSEKPYVDTLSSLLTSRGYTVETKMISDGSIDLAPKVSTYYIVEKDFPDAAVVVASLAKANNAWVFIVDSNNLPSVISHIKGKKVILVGYFKRSIKNSLDKYKTDEIINPSKFKLSLLVADRFLSEHPTTQVIVTDGKALEGEMFNGHSPVIIVGSNLLPKETMNWLIKNDIKTCVLIGMQLTYVGEQIRTLSNKEIAVFVKYGEALPGSPVYALTMMPLPSPKLKLEVISVIYDPSLKKLLINFKNAGNRGLFELTNFRVIYNGREIASAGDKSAYFIGTGESLIVSYSVTIPTELLSKNLTVQFFTSYGESPDSLDMYLTNVGRFGPPLTKTLRIKKIEDNSKLNVTQIVYYKNLHRLGITVVNLGNVPTYFIVKLPSIEVQGVPTALQSKVSLIQGKKIEVFIPVRLDDLDLQDNSNVKVVIDYGEKKNLFVKSYEATLPLMVKSFGITGFIVSATGIGIISAIVVVVGIVFFYILRKRKAEKREKRLKRRRKKKR